ncbi:MAG TPA: TonB-dependent receptor [Burkholderiales bacterium]|nr:TonB-dependent receptor [Burkholderiales bacterium]
MTVIDSQQLASSGQQTLGEVLQALGGVEMASSGGFGQPTSIFIRGANSDHTLVLIDGVRVNSATTGAAAFENIPVNQIQRIEIVPGPLSSLYGSEAVGGVIQIFTKSGRDAPAASVSAGGGTYDTRSITAAANGGSATTDFGFTGGYLESRGFDATTPSSGFNNPDRDGYRNRNFSARFAHRFDADNEIGLTALQSQGSTHFDTGPGFDDVNDQTISVFSAYTRNQFASWWQSQFRAAQSQDKQVISGQFPGFVESTQPQLTWQNDFQLPVGTIIAGAEYLEQKVAANPVFAVTSREIDSAFAGYQGEYGRNAWQFNLRQDDNSQFGDHVTWSANYAFRLTQNLRLRGGAGTAFHAPTFNDLYSPFGANPDLRPESSRSRQAGLDYASGAQRAGVTYFENRIHDLIVLGPAPAFIPFNTGSARITGTELYYQLSFEELQLRANATFQNPVDQQTGMLLQRRAQQFGGVSAMRNAGAWNYGAEFVGSGRRFDSTNQDPATRMAGYGLVNLFASYRIDARWSVSGRWNNVFDRGYVLEQGFNTPGSNVFASIQYEIR